MVVDVSIIIPVWNAEHYLGRCLDSIQQQSLETWEAVCVDDGSSDRSGDILRQRAQRDSRFRLLRQDHMGPGAARNLGIDHAQGEYLYFLDSDDWIVPDALERLVTRAREDGADLLFFESLNGERSVGVNRRVQRARHKLSTQIFSGVDYLRPALAAKAFSYSPCLQFSARHLVHDNNVRYPLRDMSEDSVFTIQLTLHAQRVSYRPEQLFYRRLRPGSLTTRGNSIAAIRGALLSWQAIRTMQEHYPTCPSTRRALGVLARRHWRYALHQWDSLPGELLSSLSWRNILEHHEQLSRRFLSQARRGSGIRAGIRLLQRRKPLVLEPAPTENST